MQSYVKSGVIVVVASLWSMLASAGEITCGIAGERTATLDSAEVCHIGLKNPKDSTIKSYFGGDWTNLGGVTSKTGPTVSYLTFTLLSGSWGDAEDPASGTWAIAPEFWTEYGSAVLSIHVGNGGGDPDHFAWSITQGQTSGDWSYTLWSGTGGGLSNMHLWGSGEPAPTLPEPPVAQVSESNLALLSILGLFAILVARRRV